MLQCCSSGEYLDFDDNPIRIAGKDVIVHEQLWEQLEPLDRKQTAARADCEYIEQGDCYQITFLNRLYTVDMANRSISQKDDSGPVEAQFIEQLCILAYLIGATNIPLANELVKGESFPGGLFFFRGGHALPTQKVADVFGDKPELLFGASEHLAAEKASYGDASVTVPVLPRLPVTVVVWGGDDEFEASGSILFDKTGSEHIALDAMLSAVNQMINSMAEKVAQQG